MAGNRIKRRRTVSVFAIAVALVVVGFLGTATSGDAAHATRSATDAETIPPYLPRVGHHRPLVAIVAENDGTEVTDYVIPYGILTRSGAADVIDLAIASGPIQMDPALKVQPQAAINDFDTRFPEGADYVFVPAVHHPEDAALKRWVRAQAGKGAVIVGICDGVWVLANAGLLKGHRATGHWYSLDELEHKFADTTWVRNRRYVADGTIVTTTGVTASIPVSLVLVQAIAGADRARQVARDVGAADWSSVHNSNDFGFDTRLKLTAAGNALAFWSHEDVGIAVSSATDEIALALVADAYSRTKRSRALTISNSNSVVRLRGGLNLVPDVTRDKAPAHILAPFDSKLPVPALDWALDEIAGSYGEATAAYVATQMEYPRRASVSHPPQ